MRRGEAQDGAGQHGSGRMSEDPSREDGEEKPKYMKSLGKTFSSLTTDALNLRRNVSFNNISAFPSMPRGSIKVSNQNLAALTKSHTELQAGEMSEETEPVFSTKRLVVVMVGLPARGKSYMSQALCRYLSWLGYSARVFNVGMMRRMLLGTDHKAKFFDPNNEEAKALRWNLAMETMTEMITWLKEENGNVAVFDATNTTVDRRRKVHTALDQAGIRVLYLESICTDTTVVEKNITATKLFSPDYVGKDPEEAVRDFKTRIANYEKAYETVGEAPVEKDYSYLKVVDVGKQLVLNQITGYVQGKIVTYLMNTHIMPRTIYLSRHGESKWNVTGQLGGDPPLTERGKAYAIKLADFMNDEFLEMGKQLPLVWTSQLKRTRQTVEYIPTMNVCWRALNEIDAGNCEGMTYEEIQTKMPEVAEARRQDKLRYRYPMGESYVDVIQRLEPVILELERQREAVLIVAHNAIIRAIYAYYMGISQEECPNLDIPLHTVFKIVPRAYKCDYEVINLQVENSYNNKTPEDTPLITPQDLSAPEHLSSSHQSVDSTKTDELIASAQRQQRGFPTLLDSHGNIK